MKNEHLGYLGYVLSSSLAHTSTHIIINSYLGFVFNCMAFSRKKANK